MAKKKKQQQVFGQMKFLPDGTLIDNRPTTSVGQERTYWNKLKIFVDCVATYCRTYSLYCGIEKSPSLDELERRIRLTKNKAERQKAIQAQDTLQNKLDVMRNRHHCATLEELLHKAVKEYNQAKQALKNFLYYSSSIGYPISTELKPVKGKEPVTLKSIIINFSYIQGLFPGNANIDGCGFRKFVKEKYVKKSLEALDKGIHAPVVSLYEMYDAYYFNKKNKKP
jgi:hypothetical protein